MIDAAARSLKGQDKRENEDSYYLSVQNGIFVVADGFYGDGRGKAASQATVEIIGSYFGALTELLISEQRDLTYDVVIETFYRAFEKAQTEVINLIALGTTVVAAFVVPDRIYIAHAGDSRAYLIRRSNICRLTDDHSLIAAAVRMGEITSEEAKKSRHKDILTRALGRLNYHPDIKTIGWQPGDCFLLATDGLTEALDDDKIRDILLFADPKTACKRLIDSAISKGYYDDITVIIFSMSLDLDI